MPADERAERNKTFTNPRYVILGYTQKWLSPDGAANFETALSPAGSSSAHTFVPQREASRASGIALTSGTTQYNGLYLSIAVSWDTDVHFEYRYDVQAYFDWIGGTAPWNGVAGDDGMSIYWGNSLALLSDYFWGKYRDGTNLQDISRSDAPPNCCDGFLFWEAKNNFGSVADYGWLDATVARATYTNFITNFTVKYVHSWANYNYTFAWGVGPSVSFSPSTSTQGIAAYTSIRT